MKNAFVAVRRMAAKDGAGKTILDEAGKPKLFQDDDGAFYLEAHPHGVLKGKEFTGPTDMIRAIRDHQAKGFDPLILAAAGAAAKAGNNDQALAILAALAPEPLGEVICLNVLEF